jgi:hypothetical protein
MTNVRYEGAFSVINDMNVGLTVKIEENFSDSNEIKDITSELRGKIDNISEKQESMTGKVMETKKNTEKMLKIND